MKQSQNGRRGRSRSGARKSGKGQDPNRVEIKVRGNPKQLLEKYKNAARDAMQAGDRVLAEHNLQFADHYQRVLNEMRGLTKGLFSGDYVVVERENSGPAADRDDLMHENVEDVDGNAAGEQTDGAADDGAPRSRRSRRGRPQQQAAIASDQLDEESSADPAEGEQPQEVHPELELDEAEKPRPRRTSRRGRRPSPPREGSEEAPAAQEGDAA